MPDDLFTVTFVGGLKDGKTEQLHLRGRCLVVSVACPSTESRYDWGQQEYAWDDLDMQHRTVTARLVRDTCDLASREPILCRRCGGEVKGLVVSANFNPCVCLMNYILSGERADA